MPAPRRRLARPVTSRRYLALRHGRAILKRQEREAAIQAGLIDILDEPVKLAPGYARLHSAQIPGLRGGNYVISAKQVISVNTKDPKTPDAAPETLQPFEVQAPRYSLPVDAIYSVYPAPGHTATVDVLPHVVFNDPEMPWARVGSWDSERLPEPAEPPKDWSRNRVPWLAVLVFTQEELKLTPDETTGIFESTSLKGGKALPSETLDFSIPKDDLKLIKQAGVVHPYTDNDITSMPEAAASMVFLQPKLFNAVFANYDAAGKATPRQGRTMAGTAATAAQHRFLASVQRINPAGMAIAGEEDEIPDRDFGIIVSNRTGPLTSAIPAKAGQPAEPQTVVAHLVSIEGVEEIRPYPVDTSKVTRVGLISLHSWTYECLPPDSIGPADALTNLGLSTAPLRAQYTAPPDATPVQRRMVQRLEDGYALSQFRFQTGEDTVSLYRGPLAPKMVDPLKSTTSNSGSSLQILDNELGIMDISYSAAWQLGRTLAIANRAYTTALTRVRRAITAMAADEAQKKVLAMMGMRGLSSTRAELLKSLSTAVQELDKLSRSQPVDADITQNTQWSQPLGDIPDLAYDSRGVRYFVDDDLTKAARKVASSTEGDQKDPPPYDEYNTPYSADWVVVLRFILDLYHLVDIPMHYLLPDPAQLPRETLRMFVIDKNWVKALVDGALSLGNQGVLSLTGVDEQPDDLVRRAIGNAVDRYFEFENTRLKYKPPVPHFGFMMRSNIVTQFPDLKINVVPEQDLNKAPLLLRHEVVGADMMMGMFGDLQQPEGVLKSLTFTLPPHQQYFSIGRHVKPSDVSLSYKRIYTQAGHENDKDLNLPFTDSPLVWEHDKTRSDGRPQIYIWDTQPNANDVRILLAENLANDLYSSLTTKLNTDANKQAFVEICPTSAMLVMQLNAPTWQLEMHVRQPALTSHLLAYPKPQQAEAMPDLRSWPEKVAVPPTQILAAAAKKGLKLEVKSPYYHPLLPSEFLIPDQKARVTDDDDSNDDDQAVQNQKNSRRGARSFLLTKSSCSPSTASQFHSVSPTTNSFRILEFGQPDWKCTARPATDPKSTTIATYPGKQDIVFSIIYKGNGNGFRLASMVIEIFMQGADTDDWLMATYDTNSVTMVSNLRFNVRATYSKKSRSLQLLVVPRSRNRWVWCNPMVRDKTDVSVVLNGVRVRQVTQPRTIHATVTPRYVGESMKAINCDVNLVPPPKV